MLCYDDAIDSQIDDSVLPDSLAFFSWVVIVQCLPSWARLN